MTGIFFNTVFQQIYLKPACTHTGEKVFHGNVTTRVLHVEKTVNNHHLHNALTLDTNQTVEGTLRLLNGFEVPTGDLTVENVNGVNWKAVREHGVHPAILKLQGINKNVTIRNLCSIGGSLAAGHLKVNGESLEDLLNDIVYSVSKNIFSLNFLRFIAFTIIFLHAEWRRRYNNWPQEIFLIEDK
jgi:hypothetical protein